MLFRSHPTAQGLIHNRLLLEAFKWSSPLRVQAESLPCTCAGVPFELTNERDQTRNQSFLAHVDF